MNNKPTALARREFLTGAGLVLGAVAIPGVASAEPAADNRKEKSVSETKPTIVLVHGAFADGSSWGRVITRLAKDGFTCVAVQNPLTSTKEDIETTRRAVDAINGPVVLVGHSYGGFVISQAASGAKNVKALVYVAAISVDEGESYAESISKFPVAPLGAHLKPDAAGFLFVDRARFREIFCPDVDAATAAVMNAAQKPIAGTSLGEKSGPVAWHTLPTFYAVSTQDQAVAPEYQRFTAKRMNATTISLDASHASLVSHPKEIAALIEKAAA